MIMLGTKRVCRVRIAKDELEKMTKEDFHKSWLLQEQYLDYIESKLSENTDLTELVALRESEEKLKQQQLEATRRENTLVMRLTTKEQEMQDYAAQIQELKQGQIPHVTQLRSALLDPAVNLMFERMRKEIETLKARLEETQEELSAWKFTPDSNTGKRLMAKCRLLHQENEELGKTLSSGRFAKLEGDLALQKSYSEEMGKTQSELYEIVRQLEEEEEGMQSTIYFFQQQLRESKEQIQKLQKENEKLLGLSLNSPVNNCILRDEPKVTNHDKTLLVPDSVKQNTSVSTPPAPNVTSVHSPATSPILDLDRTEKDSNSRPAKEKNSGQVLSPPSYEEMHSSDSHLTNQKIKIESPGTPESRSPKQTLPESKVRLEKNPSPERRLESVLPSFSVATARGSLHMEEYDSEQETEPAAVTESSKEDLFVAKPSEPIARPTKVTEPTNKRTSENGGKGRKRTRGSRTHAHVDDNGSSEMPSVKRLRRRDVIVENEVPDSNMKRTPLEIDTDTEVQVAHTLAQWAATNKERKDAHCGMQELVTENLGNGELKESKLSDKTM